MSNGVIHIFPNLIAEDTVSKAIPSDVQAKIISLRIFIVENLKIARRYLRKLDRTFPIDDCTFYELNNHTNPKDIESFITPIFNGNDIGVMSDAGCPGIADPGNVIVNLAHRKNIKVIPYVGPSSILMALISSGLNGQNFSFNGYLPKDKYERTKLIRILESKSKAQTQIFMDTPYRNNSILTEVLSICADETRLCIAFNIMAKNESIRTKSIKNWKGNVPNLVKAPCLFLLG